MATANYSNTTINSSVLPKETVGDSVTLSNVTVNGSAYAPEGGPDSLTMTNSSLAGGFSGGVGDDTLSATSSSIGNNVSLQEGNDSLAFDTVTMSGGNRSVYGGAGNDTLSMNSVDRLAYVGLGDGDDNLTLSNSTLSFGSGIDAGAGSDSVELQNASLPFGHSVSLGTSAAGGGDSLVAKNSAVAFGNVTSSGAGSASLTIDNSSLGSNSTDAISLGNTGGGSVLITNTSTINGPVSTGTGNETIDVDGGSEVRGIIQTRDGVDHISVSDGATVNVIEAGAGGDSIHFSGGELTDAIRDTLTNATVGDTIRIEDSTLNNAGVVIELAGAGDLLTISNTDMGDDQVNFRPGSSTVSIDNSTVGKLDDASGHRVSLSITDSTVSRGIDFLNSSESQTINIRNSSIGDSAPTANGYGIVTADKNDQISVLGGSTLAPNNTNLGNGQDLFVLGTNTSLVTPNGTAEFISGAAETTGGGAGFAGDTLRLYGGGKFTVTLGLNERATLNDNSTVSVITSDNIDNIMTFPSQIDGTLSLKDTQTTVQITDFEALEAVPCFVNGTLITTARGDVPVEQLRAGDLVQTADAGLQPIRWAGSREVTTLDQLLHPELLPICIKQGALGNGLPLRDLSVSPQHRMLVSGKLVERMFGVEQALVAAKHLLAIDGIEQATGISGFAYVHLLFDAHQILYAEGTPSESLFAGEMAMQTMDDDSRKELELIFPDLGLPVSDFVMQPARYFVNGRQGRKLAERAVKNGVSLGNNANDTARLLVNG